jgi:hypothetical protein
VSQCERAERIAEFEQVALEAGVLMFEMGKVLVGLRLLQLDEVKDW